MIILISAYDRPLTGHASGFNPRGFVIEQPDSGDFNLEAMAGRHVMVTFWSSSDAASRLRNVYYSAMARHNPDLWHVGINMGDKPEMYREFLRLDRLDGDSLQFHVGKDVASRLTGRYGLTTCYNTFMLSPEQNVIARNPSAERVDSLLH
ncbi:MAG: hypothetical protein K2M76_03700 [Muribaculaceae bacterium]|nr:hypothetical protein [Muribaculaceae bacterium]